MGIVMKTNISCSWCSLTGIQQK